MGGKKMRNYKGWRKLLVFALATAFALSVMVGCAADTTPDAEDKGTVEFGMVNWAGCIAVSNMWRVILEDKGYDVNFTQLEAGPMFIGLARGDVDVFMDSWLPLTHEVYWNEHKDNIESLSIWYEGDAKIGLVVPSYVTIDSIADMKENADKFDNKIIGIDPGAGIMQAAERALESYDLGFELVQGSEPAMMAAFDRAYNNEEWMAITGWSPHWKFASYDIKYLDDPNGDFGGAEEVHLLANKDFRNKQPEVAAMFERFTMTDEEIGSLMGLINDGMEPMDAARKWIPENQATVDSWIQ